MEKIKNILDDYVILDDSESPPRRTFYIDNLTLEEIEKLLTFVSE